MERELLYWLLGILLVAIGLAGVVLPAIPGAPLIFAGLFVAAWVEDFVYVGKWTLTILGLLALLTYGVDFWATMFAQSDSGPPSARLSVLLSAPSWDSSLACPAFCLARLSAPSSASYRLGETSKTPPAQDLARPSAWCSVLRSSLRSLYQ